MSVFRFEMPHVPVRGLDTVLTHLPQYLTQIGLRGEEGDGGYIYS